MTDRLTAALAPPGAILPVLLPKTAVQLLLPAPALKPSPSYQGCEHYKNCVAVAAPCCPGDFFGCRLCHDELRGDSVLPNPSVEVSSLHTLERGAIDRLKCMKCGLEQRVVDKCGGCGASFGKYACLKCRLFDNVEKGQFHCDDCGLCR